MSRHTTRGREWFSHQSLNLGPVEVGQSARARRTPSSTWVNRRAERTPTFSARRPRPTTVSCCDTLATDALSRPVSRGRHSTWPGARARPVLVDSGTTTTVCMRLRLNESAWRMRTGRPRRSTSSDAKPDDACKGVGHCAALAGSQLSVADSSENWQNRRRESDGSAERPVSVLLLFERSGRAASCPSGARPEDRQVLAGTRADRALPWLCSERTEQDFGVVV